MVYNLERKFYKTKNEILLCVNQNSCNKNTSIAQFSIGQTPFYEMRRPVIENIDAKIFWVGCTVHV